MMFYFRLARELGYTVSRLLAETDSWELTAWQEYYRLEDTLEKKEKERKNREEFRNKLLSAGQSAVKKKWRKKVNTS